MLHLPPTVRFPSRDELPNDPTLIASWKASQNANITEGYYVQDTSSNNETLFNFYAQINVNNAKLWELFMLLTNEFPEEVSLIYGSDDDSINHTNYQAKAGLLQKISTFSQELTQDAFLQWGIIHHDDHSLIEVFVTHYKYIKFWGMNKVSFLNTLHQLGIEEIADLKFVDTYPNIRTPLTEINKKVLITNDLIQELSTI